MRKQIQTLAALALLLVLCLGGYFALRGWNQAQEKASHTYLARMTQVTGLSYDREGETLSFTRGEDGSWTWEEDGDFPVDGDKLDDIAGLFAALEAVRTIQEPEALSSYGLDTPQRTISVRGQSDSEVILLLGDPVDSNYYYAMLQGGGTVYTVSSELFDTTGYSLLELAQVPQLPTLTQDNVESVTLREGDVQLSLIKTAETQVQETGEADGEGEPVVREVTFYTWSLDGQVLPEDSQAVDELVSALFGLEFTACQAFKPSQAELDTMGLTGSGVLEVTIQSGGGQTLALLLGQAADEEENTVYAMEADACLVYAMDSDTAETLWELLDADWTAVPEDRGE